MMILSCSDLHAHKYKQFNQENRRLENAIRLLEYLFKLANKNGITTITFSGDLFNNMQVVHTEAIAAVSRAFIDLSSIYPDIQFVAISGNHDQATRNTGTNDATSALEAIYAPNFKLIDFTMTGDAVGEVGIWGIPYYDNKEDFHTALLEQARDAAKCDYKTKILLMHQTMGFDIPGVPEDVSPDEALFDKFDYVLNGHIHKHTAFGNGVFNIGSPMHRDAGDIGVRKGVLIIDPGHLTEFFDITDKFPQFIRKTIGDPLTEWEENQYVIWVPAPIETTPEEKEIQEKFTHTNNSKEDLINNFLDVFTSGVDKTTVKSIKSYQAKIMEYAAQV